MSSIDGTTAVRQLTAHMNVRDGCVRRRVARAIACTSRTFLRKTTALSDLTLILNFIFRCIRSNSIGEDQSRKFFFSFFTRVGNSGNKESARGSRAPVRGDFCGPAADGTRETWPQEQVSDPRTTFRGTRWMSRELRVHRSLERRVRDEPASKVKFALTR